MHGPRGARPDQSAAWLLANQAAYTIRIRKEGSPGLFYGYSVARTDAERGEGWKGFRRESLGGELWGRAKEGDKE